MNKTFLWIIVVVVVLGAGYWIFTKNKDIEPVSGESIKIGALLPLTGAVAHYGEESQRGLEIAEEYLKEKYPELNLKIITEESYYTPKGGVDAYQKLRASDNVSIVITGGSPVAVPVKPLTQNDGVLQMAIWTIAPSYGKDGHNLNYRAHPLPDEYMPPLTSYITNKQFETIGVLHAENEFGNTFRDAFKEAAPGLGITIVSESFPLESNDLRTQLTKLKSARVDIIMYIGTIGQLISGLKQGRELGIKAQFMSVDVVEDQALLKGAPQEAEGVVYVYPFDHTTTEAKELLEYYKANYGGVPTLYAAEAFVGLQLIGEALHSCDNKLDLPCMKQWLDNVSNFTSPMGVLSVDQDGDFSVGDIFLKTVKNGQFVKLEN